MNSDQNTCLLLLLLKKEKNMFYFLCFWNVFLRKYNCQIQIYSTVVIPPHFQMTSMNGYTGIRKTEVLVTFCFWQFCAPLYSSSMKFVFGMTSAHEGSWRLFYRHINMIRSCVCVCVGYTTLHGFVPLVLQEVKLYN